MIPKHISVPTDEKGTRKQLSSSQMGLMSPEGDLAAAEAPGGTLDPVANPCPPVLARKVLGFSPETWRGTTAGRCFQRSLEVGEYRAPGWGPS